METLPHENLLTALDEVSAAFVGLSVVVGMIGARAGRSLPETLKAFAVREVAELGLVAVGASLLLLAIRALGASQVVTWRLARVGFSPAAGI